MTITPEQLIADIQRKRDEANALRELWRTLFDSCPADSQFALWLSAHPFARMVYAVNRTGAKYARRNRQMTEQHTVKLTSKIANDQQRFEESTQRAA